MARSRPQNQGCSPNPQFRIHSTKQLCTPPEFCDNYLKSIQVPLITNIMQREMKSSKTGDILKLPLTISESILEKPRVGGTSLL